ncbi:thermonuclease family protein [Pseudoroseomonas cervicalis]|uniref:thermonuclease family protein n=1 Tax=Teichococcus cervicalis TaxID=204525 RepID=UPI00277FF53F|nr:thermonuclease family protein [Pseudoroseomonas cervicalis]MDQ1078023.1 endonuclease YncB(thermonuclease family) [Pseudoroseomonas cervicalis]
MVSLLVAQTALATDLRGQVVGVHDGDTLTLLTSEREQVRIRLAEIDAPETRQPWGTRARQALAAIAFQKPATVVVVDTDRYGRTVGTVWVEGRNVNAEMVRAGHAWVYRQYLRDRSLLAVEDEARRARRGLWRLPEAERVPPWVWRRERRDH